jgi:hypothetical protein
LVMMLMTPLTALAPHSVAPGPRITSIRSTSSRERCPHPPCCSRASVELNRQMVDGG